VGGSKDSSLSAVEFELSDESELFGCSLSSALASVRALASELIALSLFLVTRSRKRVLVGFGRTDRFIMVGVFVYVEVS